jgi:hypothetical protein
LINLPDREADRQQPMSNALAEHVFFHVLSIGVHRVIVACQRRELHDVPLCNRTGARDHFAADFKFFEKHAHGAIVMILHRNSSSVFSNQFSVISLGAVRIEFH